MRTMFVSRLSTIIAVFLHGFYQFSTVSGQIQHISRHEHRRHESSPKRFHQTLASFWDITAGTPSYDSLTFTFPYTIHSSKVNNVAVNVLGANCEAIDSSAFNATSNLNADGTGVVDIVIDPTLIAASSTYSETGGDATVTFCHRFSLFDDTTEVNFVRTVATVTIDLSHDFSVTSVDVSQADVLTSSSSLQYSATAYYCDELGDVVSISEISQGFSVTVCIEPDDGNVVEIDRLADFVWTSETGIVQYAVDGDGNASNAFSVVDCSSLVGKCTIESLFVANFFQDAPISVSSTGKVLLQFKNSRRNLQRGGDVATSDEKKYAAISVVQTPSFIVTDVKSSAMIQSFKYGKTSVWAIVSTSFILLFGLI